MKRKCQAVSFEQLFRRLNRQAGRRGSYLKSLTTPPAHRPDYAPGPSIVDHAKLHEPMNMGGPINYSTKRHGVYSTGLPEDGDRE